MHKATFPGGAPFNYFLQCVSRCSAKFLCQFTKHLSDENFNMLCNLVYENTDSDAEERWAMNKLQAKCFVNSCDHVMELAIRGIPSPPTH